MRIVRAAMIASVLFMLAITLFARPIGDLPEIFAYGASGWAVLSLPIASVVRTSRWPATTPDQDKDYWTQRGAAHVASMGLLEGPALFCCIALLLSKPVWPLVALLVPMGGMVAWFPRGE